MTDPTDPLLPEDRPDTGAAGSGVPEGAPPPGPDETPEKRLGRRITARRVAVGFTALVVLLIVALGAALLYLNTDGGRERLRGVAVQQIANVFAEDATVSVERLEGNVLTGARLIGFKVERGGETVLAVDTLLVDYSLRTLLNKTFSASDLTVVGPRLIVRQREDGTLNTAGLIRPADPDKPKGGFSVLIDHAVVRDGRAEVHWYNPTRDSTLVLDGVQASLRDIVSAPDSLHGDIESSRFTAIAPLAASRMDVSAAGRFSKSEVFLRELMAQSSLGSRVRGSARVGYGEAAQAGDALPVFEADIEATPLAMADARAFGGVQLYGDPRLRLTASSDGGTLTVGLRGSLAPGDGGPDAVVALDGELTRATDGPVRYRAEGQLRRFNPAVLTHDPATAADLTGDLNLSLQGSDLRSLDGPFRVTLRDSRAAGRTIDRLSLDGAFAAGRVTFDLDGAIPGLDLTAEGDARPFERVPSFAVRGRARDANLAVLLPGQGISGRLAGDVAVEGRGNSLDSFIGTVAATLGRTDVTVGGKRYLLDRADVDADIDGGVADYDADVTVGNGGGRLLAAGRVDPTRPTLVYTVDRGRLERLDVSKITGDPAQRSDLTGTFTLNGQGTDVRTLAADVTARLRGSTYGTYPIAAADVDARLRNGALAFDATADLGRAGALTATGTARPFSDPLVVEARGRVRRIDLAALTGDPAQASSISGQYEVTTRGLDPATLTADARIRLEPSSVAGRLVDASDLRVQARRGDVTLTGTLDTPDGSVALNVNTRPFDASPVIRLGEGTCFRNVDAGRLAQNKTLSTDLTGCATGTVSGYATFAERPADLNADLVVTLDPSTVNGARIRRARADVVLAGGTATGSLEALLAEARGAAGPAPTDSTVADLFDGTGGRLRLSSFRVRPFDERLSYALRGTTDGLDVAALGTAAAASPRTSLSLSFDVDGAGTDPRTLALTADVSTRRSAIGPTRLDTLETQLALRGGILTVDTLVVRSDVATADGGGTVALFDASAASDFRLAGDIRSLAAFRDSLGQSIGLERGAFDLTATAAAGAPLAVNGSLSARRLARGDFRVRTFDGTLDVTVDRARLLAQDTLNVARALTDGTVRGRAGATFDSLTVGERRVVSGYARASIAELAALPDTATAVPAALAAAPRLGLDLEASVTVDQRRDITLNTRIDLPRAADVTSPGAPLTLRLENAVAGIDETTWTLLRPTAITLDDGIAVDSLVVRSDALGPDSLGAVPQQITANGAIRYSGDQDFTISVQGVDIAALSDIAGAPALGGMLSADARVTGTAANPLLDARIGADNLSSPDGVVGALAATVGYADGLISVDATVTHVDGQTLVAAARLPRRISLDGGFDAGAFDPDGAIQLSTRAQAFPIAWARPFLDDRTYSALDGTLDLDVTGGGTFASPDLAGTAMLRDGKLGVIATGLTYQPITADVAFTNNRIDLRRVLIGAPATGVAPDSVAARGQAAGGDGVDVTGSITLENLALGTLDLTIRPRDFTAIDTRTYKKLILAAGAEPLRLTGTLAAPVLRGSVSLARGDIYVTDELIAADIEPVELTPGQIRTVEQRFGREIAARDTSVSRFTKALDYDLQVSIGRNVWIRSGASAGIGYDIEFTGDIQATKTPYAEAGDLFGQIDLINGNIRTFNKRFTLDRGTLVFNGPALAARADIQASTDVRLSQSISGQSAVTILLAVSGNLDQNPEITLSSDPVLEPSDIISLVATGQLASNAGAGAAVGAGAGLLAGTVSSGIEQAANESLGLDLTQISYENGNIVIKVGKYLSERIFVTLGFIPATSSSGGRSQGGLPIQATLDYEILQWLQAQGEFSGQRGVGAGLAVERSF